MVFKLWSPWNLVLPAPVVAADGMVITPICVVVDGTISIGIVVASGRIIVLMHVAVSGFTPGTGAEPGISLGTSDVVASIGELRFPAIAVAPGSIITLTFGVVAGG